MSELAIVVLVQLALHLIVTVIHRFQWIAHIKHLEREFGYERAEWKAERQQLLDRIQAPSFAEYKHQEAKVIKAQSGEKEPPKIEQL